MAKINSFLILLCFLFLFSNNSLANNCLIKTAESQVGVVEKTGNNDGVQVEAYLKTVGLGKGYSYCAAFVKWVFLQCGYKTNINAWSPTAHNKNNVVFENGRFQKEPKPLDVFTIYSLSKKRIVHTGFYRSYYNSKLFLTIEGNTSPTGAVGSKQDVDGHGVYKKLRSYNQTYSITRHIP